MPKHTLGVVVSVALALSACKKTEEEAPSANQPPATKTADDGKVKKPAEPPADTVVGEEVTYEAGGVTMKGYLAWDKAVEGPRPGVLVVHEWWGHNEYVRTRARTLAKMGYTALAVDMYGDGKQAAHPGDAKKFAMEVIGNKEAAMGRFVAAHKVLAAHSTTNPEKTAAIGYCFGGGVVLHMARAGTDLAGVASFHGTLKTDSPAKKGEVKARVFVAHGNADPFVPAEDVKAFQDEMKAAGATLKFMGFDGAKHAFTNPGATDLGKKFSLPLEYSADADTKSWAELATFLKEIFADS